MILSGENVSVGISVPFKSNFNFAIGPGDCVALIGPNGVGKTTFFRTLIGELPLLSGQFFWGNENIRKFSLKERAKIFSCSLSSHYFYSHLDIKDLLWLGRMPYDESEDEKRIYIEKVCQDLELEKFLSKKIGQLSDGQQQYLKIALNIIQDCPVLIFDEPTNFLDIYTQDKLITLFKSFSEAGKIVIFSSHNLYFVEKIAKKVWFFQESLEIKMGTKVAEFIDLENLR